MLGRPARRPATTYTQIFRAEKYRTKTSKRGRGCAPLNKNAGPKLRGTQSRNKCRERSFRTLLNPFPPPLAVPPAAGATVCDPDKVIILEKMVFPDPVIHVAVEPKTKADQEKMGVALHRLAQEDPSFRVHTDEESGQTIISGMGELHLEIIVDRMKREFGVDANVGAPQVAYREAMRKSVEQEGKFIRQSGGRGQYGHVKLRLDPQPPGTGYELVDAIQGGRGPERFDTACKHALQGVLP